MSFRELSGEQVVAMYEVRSDNLSRLLSEATSLVGDLEKEESPYPYIFSMTIDIQVDEDDQNYYEALIFVRK